MVITVCISKSPELFRRGSRPETLHSCIRVLTYKLGAKSQLLAAERRNHMGALYIMQPTDIKSGSTEPRNLT